MAESSPLAKENYPSIAGTKRPSSALLPPFELASSPPALPRPAKRVARESFGHGNPLLPSALSDDLGNKAKYPTPVPTSETNIFSSSPPLGGTRRRPALERSVSTLSQREPLGTVPTAELDASGTEMLFGRSGKSSHFQLHSLNKNISRVHLRAAYVPAAGIDEPARVEILCMGWNGMKVHCQGQHWEMDKHDTFTSEAKDTDIMVDVADTRVVIQWPKIGRKVTPPESSDEEAEFDATPTRRPPRMMVQRSPQNSLHARFISPLSPKVSKEESAADLRSSDLPAVQIYEDHDSEQEDGDGPSPTQASTQIVSQVLNGSIESFMTQDFSDADEENDPLITSFGPMGANLLPKMASFRAGASPDQRRALQTVCDAKTTPGKQGSLAETSTDIIEQPGAEPKFMKAPPARIIDISSHPVINHVVNQLAFSRLNQLPLSMIMNHLPSDLKKKKEGSDEKLDFDELRSLIGAATCIGEVRRVGKDAAGMALESEYYYIPDHDFDVNRKEAVVGQLRKPGLRACRKQHKQYYWRKPK